MSLEDDIMRELSLEIIEDIDKEIRDRYLMATSSSAVGGPYDAVDTTISTTGPKITVTVDSVKAFAGNNLLTVAETHQMDAIQSLSEDDFKRMAKSNLSNTLAQEVIKKTKFTMLREPASHTVRTKASVYVFSEEDLRIFMEKLINYR